jgi:hypothetical protein
VEVDLKALCGAEARFVVMLLGDSLSSFSVTAPNPAVCEFRFCPEKWIVVV